MTDYKHPITFGLSLDPETERLGQTRALAQAAEDAGLDYLAVQDHPYQPSHLDAWTLINHLSAQTQRISFLTDVADLQLRAPTMLAKSAATLSLLTGGRVILGVGGGATADGIAAMGGARRDGREMVTYTDEALQVMRAALDGRSVRLRSQQHTIEGYNAGPVPPTPVPIWLGSQKPRMLAVTGCRSDGWISPLNIYVPPAEVPVRQAIIDDAARSAGRDPSSIRRIYNVLGAIGALRGASPGLTGDVQQWIDTLSAWAVDLGFDTFIFWPTITARTQLDVFAAEVIPGVRERVHEMRGQL